MDLIYYRNQFKQHLSICVSNEISKDSFAYEHCGGFYLKQLEDIELKSFISVMKLHDPSFGLSEIVKKQRNKELNRIAKEIIDEILEEEKNK